MTSLNILVAEEEPLNALALAAQLNGLGHEVVGPASTRETTLLLARRREFELAIIDLGLSGERTDLAREVFRHRPVPIIAVTEYGDPDVARRVARGEIFHHLVKPISPDDVAPAIELALRRFRIRRETQGPIEC